MSKTRKMTNIAMIAGIYAAITFATFFMSFGQIQYRVSEVLTILPIFTANAIPGLTLGCAIANITGFFIGVNPLGLMDALFGTGATLIAAIITYYLGKVDNKWVRYIFCPLPAVVVNAVVIGFELTWIFNAMDMKFFLPYAASVFIGQAVVCYGLGIPVIAALKKNNLYKRIFE